MPGGLPTRPTPTARQAEYLAFIRAFTERWGIPPSFEEIARHFMTTAPSVNSMVKTLEARGFLARVPGRPRTLRVLLPETPAAPTAAAPGRPAAETPDLKAAVQLASLVVERLVPALKGVSEDDLVQALDAVADALETAGVAAGASPAARRDARAVLVRVALIARGMSPETRPGRKLPWWHGPR